MTNNNNYTCHEHSRIVNDLAGTVAKVENIQETLSCIVAKIDSVSIFLLRTFLVVIAQLVLFIGTLLVTCN